MSVLPTPAWMGLLVSMSSMRIPAFVLKDTTEQIVKMVSKKNTTI